MVNKLNFIFVALICIGGIYLISKSLTPTTPPPPPPVTYQYQYQYLICDDVVRKEISFVSLAYDEQGSLNTSNSEGVLVIYEDTPFDQYIKVYFTDERSELRPDTLLSLGSEEKYIRLTKWDWKREGSAYKYTYINRISLAITDYDKPYSENYFGKIEYKMPRSLGVCIPQERSEWQTTKTTYLQKATDHNNAWDMRKNERREKSLNSRKI